MGIRLGYYETSLKEKFAGLIKLFMISIFKPLIYLPIKKVVLVICGILRIYKWDIIFQYLESNTLSTRVAFWKTIYLNYRCLNKNQAYKFPILVYTNTEIISATGKINFEECDIFFGMVRWGWFHSYRSQGITRIQIRGNIVFKGPGKIFKGSEIVVFPNASLTIGESFFIGENVLLYCQEKIYIDKSVCISYQSDISDSDFHYSINIYDGKVLNKTSPIIIGSYNWFAGRTTIKKGVHTPDYLMVASSGSVLSKDYSKIVAPYSIMGGCPAKVIKEGISRIWHDEFHNIEWIDKEFELNSEVYVPQNHIKDLIKI